MALEEAFKTLLVGVGEDPTRSGLIETPKRAARAWREWCGGYSVNVEEIFKTFEDGAQGYDGMVVICDLPLFSKCEHHLADIIGIAHIGYIPQGSVAGLSKFARLVDAYGRRLQVQERLTAQIADAIMKHLKPEGAGVIIEASHHCMSTRGVKVHGSVTKTAIMRGSFYNDPATRNEFLDRCRR